MKMADVIHLDYSLIPIIDRFGIEFGFGNKTVGEVCAGKGINTWFFLAIINSYHNRDYFPADQIKNFSLAHIITYLSNTHHYFLETKIPEIQGFINLLLEDSSDDNIKNIRLLNDFFNNYVEEIKEHFSHEEDIVFPYIREIEMASKGEIPGGSVAAKIIDQPIETYERQHDNLEVKLTDLKNLIIKFLPPVKRKDIIQKLLMELFRVERDLNDHAHIEEKVVVPKVKQLEQQILKLNDVSNG
jgi:regulator of cell morphogenesis and NO signaling